MVTAGITSTFTWVAAAVPTAATTHVDILPPLLMAIGVAVLGAYVMMASDNRNWWLPGRKKMNAESEQRLFNQRISEMGVSSGTEQALRQIANQLEQIAKALSAQTREPEEG